MMVGLGSFDLVYKKPIYSICSTRYSKAHLLANLIYKEAHIFDLPYKKHDTQ